MKRVAVQDNLIEIQEALKDKGYHVVSFYDQGNVDAIVYTDDYTGLVNINNGSASNDLGAVIINAYNKQIAEIEYIIEKRRYGNLFS